MKLDSNRFIVHDNGKIMVFKNKDFAFDAIPIVLTTDKQIFNGFSINQPVVYRFYKYVGLKRMNLHPWLWFKRAAYGYVVRF